MKITTTITELVISHEVSKEVNGENDILITRVESVGPIVISENGIQQELTEKEELYDLVKCLQKGAHNYISTKLKGDFTAQNLKKTALHISKGEDDNV